jgi:hypothetical protein
MRRTGLKLIGRCAIVAGLCLELAAPGLAATLNPSNEGYDLMRQITTQFARPNILIVLDASGSMAWDYLGNNLNIYSPPDSPYKENIVWPGVDSVGTTPLIGWVGEGFSCPTPTPTPPGPTATRTWTPTRTPTRTHKPTKTPTTTPSGPTATPTPTRTRATRTPTRTQPTRTPTRTRPTPTRTATQPTRTPTRTRTPGPTRTSTRTRTPTPVVVATSTPTPTKTPTMTPTKIIGPGYGLSNAGVLLAQAGFGQSCTTWTYTFVVEQDFPSRMAVVKNVLGNSVEITTPWEAPPSADAWPPISNPNWSCAPTCVTGPVVEHVRPLAIGQHWKHTYSWTINFPEPTTDPGPPFDIYTTPDGDSASIVNPPNQATWPNVYDVAGNRIGSGADLQAALDVIGNSKDLVNWGLMIFSTQLDYVPDYYVTNEPTGTVEKRVKLVAKIDTGDTGNVDTIEAAMQLSSNGGVLGYSSTPTKQGLDFAKAVLQATAQGTPPDQPLTDDLGNTFDLPRDPKLECDRAFGSILVTDGLSNIGNPGGCTGSSWDPVGGNWAEPCWACEDCPVSGGVPTSFSGGEGCPDGGPSGFTCPDNYEAFAAGSAEDAWLAQVLDANGQPYPLKARTWVIGISKEVGPCELNYTAYRGRTDASAARGDAGYKTEADPNLPGGTPGTYDGITTPAQCTPDVSHSPTHGDYAFFTTSATSLRDAFIKIITAAGTGDYSTSGPSIATSTTLGTNIGFITTASFPSWRGHMYAYDLTQPIVCHSDSECPTTANGAGRCDTTTGECKAPDTYTLLWDFGEVLSAYTELGAPKTANDGFARTIYTWNPAAMGPDSDSLVPITAGNATALDALCGGCGITPQVVDFIQGNDGNGNPRPWMLGAILNSTAAVVSGAPEEWKQFPGHSQFEADYAARHGVAWVGSSDGMLHAVDLKDGAELLALIPPDLLTVEKEMYDLYASKPTDYPMGEPALPSQHTYGVANSPRFGDIFDPGTNTYRTVLFISEGPGGSGLHAIDVTHPFAGRTYADGSTVTADPNYGYGIAGDPPVVPLWSKTHDGTAGTTALAALTRTWSIPALAGTSVGSNWELVMGNGYVRYDAGDATTANPYPRFLRFDPLAGTVRANDQLTHLSSNQPLGGPWVRNQAFADSTIWSTSAPVFRPDNDVNQAIQLDLQGKVWLINRQDMVSTTWNAPVTLSDPSGLISGQPLYYSAAVATYPADNPQYDVYTFSSGSFYEVSNYITGPDVGIDGATPPNFIPSLYIVSQPVGGGTPTIYKKDIHTITFGTDNSQQFGHKTQVTAYPTIFVPKPGSPGNVIALFLLYDPDANLCIGNAYLVRLAFNPETLATVDPTIMVDEAGTGAASGFALAGQIPVVAKSFVGEEGKAYFYRVKNLTIAGAGGTGGEIGWWMELQ